MIIKAIDTELNRYLIGDINPIKKDVKIIQNIANKRVSLEIYSIPSYKLTFRKYSFPTKKIEFLEKSLKTQLKLDLPVDIDEVEYRYITKPNKNGYDVFCVIAKKEDLKNFPKKTIVDTDFFSLIRLAKFNGVSDGIIYHFTDKNVIKVRFKDSFPLEVRVFNEIYQIEENAYLSGKIKGLNFKNRVLNNPTAEPINNVSFGLLLKPVYDIGVDFFKKNDTDFIKNNLKSLLYLTLSLIILNFVFFINLQVKNYELKKIKEKEKEIFYKYWQTSGKIYSPLTQAKGILKNLKLKNRKKTDKLTLLNKLGRLVKYSGIESITRVYISDNRIVIEGFATNENQFKKFRKRLNRRFPINEEENYIQQSGKLKFKIEATYE